MYRFVFTFRCEFIIFTILYCWLMSIWLKLLIIHNREICVIVVICSTLQRNINQKPRSIDTPTTRMGIWKNNEDVHSLKIVFLCIVFLLITLLLFTCFRLLLNLSLFFFLLVYTFCVKLSKKTKKNYVFYFTSFFNLKYLTLYDLR